MKLRREKLLNKAMAAWRGFHAKAKAKKDEKANQINLSNQLEDLSHKYNKEIDLLN